MKKGFIIGLFLLSLFSITLVSAVSQTLPPPISVNDIQMFLTNLVSSDSGSILFVRIMLTLLLVIILYRPAEKIVGGNSGAGFLVSLIVSILAIRFLDSDSINGLLIPYTALGIALWVLIPFLLMFYFLVTSDLPSYFRKMGWAFMIVAFVYLWINRWDEIGDMSYIYLLGSLLSLGALFFDRTVRTMVEKAKLEMRMSSRDMIILDQLETSLKEIDKQIASANTEDAIKALLNERSEILKKMSKLYDQKNK